MTLRPNPVAFGLARKVRELTQGEVSELSGVSQSAFSKIEKGDIEPSEEVVNKIAKTLRFPESFFYSGEIGLGDFSPLFRKRSVIPKKIVERVYSDLQIWRFQLGKLVDIIELETHKLPEIDLEELESGPVEAAQVFRKNINLPPGPLTNLIGLAEAYGVIVIATDFGIRKVDGCSCWIKNKPFVFLNKTLVPDRMRFTLAHEIGHLILHKDLIDEESEMEADLFASELLMPKEDIKNMLLPFSLDRLARLKIKWGVSIQALLKTAQRLGIIRDRTARFYWMKISEMGYRTSEPYSDKIPTEIPTLLQEIIDVCHSEIGLDDNRIADLLSVGREDYQKRFLANTFEVNIL